MDAPADQQPRPTRIPLTGAFNFRDLGGYPAEGGRRVRAGRVFRSDQLHELTEEDLTEVARLGVRTVIDLRTDKEATRDGRGRLPELGVRIHGLSVLPERAEESDKVPARDVSLATRYLWFLDVGAPSIVAALDLLAEPGNHPAVFHCTAGKDRTGVLAGVLLGCLGVPPEMVAHDYAATTAALPQIVDRLRRHPVFGQHIDKAPPSAYATEPETMIEVLDAVVERHGSVAGWAVAAGLAPERVDALRSALLEPALTR